jgi:hypothetical protein
MSPRSRTISYQPLQPDGLRLVALQPDDGGSKIECLMEYTTFESNFKARNHRYEALSYMWGSPDSVREIYIDGSVCDVRENLYWALYHLRLTDRPRILWIDALCINQEDTKERNHQVGQMDRIYRDAKLVAVYVGRETEEDAQAMEYISKIYNERLYIQKFFRQRYYKEFWEQILVFCRREYWTRLWVIQEIMLAAKLFIYCGDNHMSYEKLAEVFRLSFDKVIVDKDSSIKNSSASRLLLAKHGGPHQVSRPRYISIVDLVLLHRGAQCLQTHDKVFGLLSLAKECCRNAVEVDYSMSLHDLCIIALRHHLHWHAPRNFFSDLKNFLDIITPEESVYPSAWQKFTSIPLCSPSTSGLTITAQVVGVICNLESLYIHDDPLSAVAQQHGTCFSSPHHLFSPHFRKQMNASALHDLNNTELARTSLVSLNILFPKLSTSFPAAPPDRHNTFIAKEDRDSYLKLYRRAKKHALKEYLKGTIRGKKSLFLTSEGDLGFCATGAQIGDLLVRFEEFGEVGIMSAQKVRKEERGEIRLVGRAVPYFQGGDFGVNTGVNERASFQVEIDLSMWLMFGGKV